MTTHKGVVIEKTPAEQLPGSDGLRETFLCNFTPKLAALFRQYVESLQELAYDRGSYEEGDSSDSFTLAEMRAVVADLRFGARFLDGVGRERRLSELTATEQSLSALAEEYAPELRSLADELEKRIELLISDEKDELASNGE